MHPGVLAADHPGVEQRVAVALHGFLSSDHLPPNLARPDSTHWKQINRYL